MTLLQIKSFQIVSFWIYNLSAIVQRQWHIHVFFWIDRLCYLIFFWIYAFTLKGDDNLGLSSQLPRSKTAPAASSRRNIKPNKGKQIVWRRNSPEGSLVEETSGIILSGMQEKKSIVMLLHEIPVKTQKLCPQPGFSNQCVVFLSGLWLMKLEICNICVFSSDGMEECIMSV